jgi:hypothetical protein
MTYQVGGAIETLFSFHFSSTSCGWNQSNETVSTSGIGLIRVIDTTLNNDYSYYLDARYHVLPLANRLQQYKSAYHNAISPGSELSNEPKDVICQPIRLVNISI